MATLNMITPPTDNLYKFMAIAGLVILVASAYWPYTEAREVHGLHEKLEAEHRLLGVERDALAADADHADALLKAVKDGSEASKEALLHVAKFAEAGRSRVHDLRRRSAATDNHLSQAEARVERVEKMRNLSIGGVGIGTGFMIWGFVLWYNRV
ncbi:MAG TPA: hypothetical protein VF614_06425, partial [Chthoniobacteraceae bacterium]